MLPQGSEHISIVVSFGSSSPNQRVFFHLESGNMLFEPWRVEMFGGLVGRQRGYVISRFRTRKTADLLAYLAFYRNRAHSREEIVEILWPDSDLDSGRHSLRQALTSLRRQFEPPGTPAGSVLIADRSILRVDPAAITTDVSEFESLLGSITSDTPARDEAVTLSSADRLYRGDLLAGSYAEWIFPERDRLAEAHRSSLMRMTVLYEQLGERQQSLDCALRLVAADPCSEEAHCAAIRLFAANGQRGDALKLSQTLVRTLWEALQERPSDAALSLIASLQGGISTLPVARAMPATPTPKGSRAKRRSTAERTPGLPLTFTRFFGRRPELDRLRDQLAESESRLITLTGPGGCGKTRLGIEVGRQMAAAFEGAVTFVPLADIDDAALISTAILDALRIHRVPTIEPLDQAGNALAQRRSLLILDNFERLVEHGGPIVRSLLNMAPHLVCLVTSRRPMELEGEQTYPLGPLPVPDQPGTPERLMEFAGIELFVDRAKRVLPDFQITTRNAADIAAVCRKLDGNPLALELAAARVHVITPGQMVAQLDDRFAFLVSRRKDIPERHRSLRATIDWSYQLLTPPVQHFFNSLSVFRGGFSLDAACEVCDQGGVLENLQQLCEQSLVFAEEMAEDWRYSLLDSLREYAWERLMETDAETRQRKHADCYVRLVEGAETLIRGPDQKECLDRLEREHDNVRSALTWSIARQDALALRLSAAMMPFWLARNHATEARDWLSRALNECVGNPGERAKTLCDAAWLAVHSWDLDAGRERAQEGLRLCRDLNDRLGQTFALISLGLAAHDCNQHEDASDYLEEAIALSRTAGDPWLEGCALLNAGRIRMDQGEKDIAWPLLQNSLDIFRQLGDKASEADALRVLAHTVQELQGYAATLALLEQAKALFAELGDTVGSAYTILSMGHVARFQGDLALARNLYDSGLGLCRPLGDAFGQAHALLNLGHLERSDGALHLAGARYAEALVLFNDLRHERGIAFSLEGFAGLWAAQGTPKRAVRMRSVADRLRESAGLPLPDLDREMYDHYILAAEESLGEQAYRSACLEGRAISLDAAIREALSDS